MNPKTYTRTLTIAGSDSGGGAGIQADLKTFSALGCYGMSVITAMTAQNTLTVAAIQPADSDFVAKQIDAVMEDIGADAVKIGMLFSTDIIRVVADRLKAHKAEKIVLDPVMVSKSGDKLLQDEAIDTMVEQLFPLATVVTPNFAEVKVLTGIELKTKNDLAQAAEDFFDKGVKNVLLKGGHIEADTATDYLYCNEDGNYESFQFTGRRADTKNTHGTGCTYASAIAAYLAQGCDLHSAILFAKQYINGAIDAGAEYKLGSGHGPLNHFYDVWNR